MQSHRELIERFYAAFAQRDWQGMVACCHPRIHYSDESYDLRGERVGLLWQMHCTSDADLRIELIDVDADDLWGCARWERHTTNLDTGRPVHQRIDAEFAFRDGLIARHVDSFDFWTWSRQAFGPRGWLMGWSDTMRDQVRERARDGLSAFGRQS